MEEYGQPMHAYDLSTIAGNEIVVKTAKAGEKFVTLDGQEREMDESVLMICDGEKSVGIAGIMGGENSMITDDVQNVLFEAACLMEQISVNQAKKSDFVQMLPENLKRDLTRTMRKRQSTEPAS